jgi:hypothetical protein
VDDDDDNETIPLLPYSIAFVVSQRTYGLVEIRPKG